MMSEIFDAYSKWCHSFLTALVPGGFSGDEAGKFSGKLEMNNTLFSFFKNIKAQNALELRTN